MHQHQYAQQIIQAVTSWDGIESYLKRFGGIQFRLGDVEIGHLHMGSGQADFPFPGRVCTSLIAAGEAEEHHIRPGNGWVSHQTRGEGDAAQAIRLFRLSYLHKRHYRNLESAAYRQALAELDFEAAVIESLKHPPSAAEAKVE